MTDIETLITKLENWNYLETAETSKEYLVLCCGWKANYGPSGQIVLTEGPAGEKPIHAPWPTYVLQDALDSLPEPVLFHLIKLPTRYQFEFRPDPKNGYTGAAKRSAAAVCIANLRRVLAE